MAGDVDKKSALLDGSWIIKRSGIWQGSFEELRCCLFHEQRRWRHSGTDPTGDQLMGLQALFLAIDQRWDIEAGGAGG
jgi:hypothetical protein